MKRFPVSAATVKMSALVEKARPISHLSGRRAAESAHGRRPLGSRRIDSGVQSAWAVANDRG